MKAFYPPWFESFAISGLKVTCRCPQTCTLGPSPGRLLRGMLKRIVQEESSCLDPKPELCARCPKADECAYLKLMMEDRTKPQPYWIDLDSTESWEGRIQAGSSLSFTCLVVGDRIPYLVKLEGALASEKHLTIDRNGIRLEIDMLEFQRLGQPTAWTTEISERVAAFSADCSDTQHMIVQLKTPTRIKHDTLILTESSDFQFPILIEAIWNRAADLATYLGSPFASGQAAPSDLILRATHVYTIPGSDLDFFEEEAVRKRSGGSGRVERTGGFKGRVTFSGNLIPFLPLLMIGEVIHIGKKTTQGLGRYLIESIQQA